MGMVHHDARDYKVACSEAAEHMRKKLETLIGSSVKRVAGVIESIKTDIPTDALVQGNKLDFTYNKETGGIALLPPPADNNPLPEVLPLHEHAFGQVCEKTGVKHLVTVLKDLRDKGAWGGDSAARTLGEIYSNMNGKKYLLRALRGEALGFLSDSYKRLDARPMSEAFVDAIMEYGARPYDGFALATKTNLRAILPMVFEPYPGEVLAIGAQLGNSMYGDGKLEVATFVLRMRCTNLASTEDVLSQIHLGRKISDNVVFSAKTIELDSQTMASAIRDVAGSVFSPEAVNKYLALVTKANTEGITVDQITNWSKKNLTKQETDTAVGKFASPDIELLPPGQTSWRWSNALSWLANETEDEHRKLELQHMAGGLIK